jgi:hypothetical protein
MYIYTSWVSPLTRLQLNAAATASGEYLPKSENICVLVLPPTHPTNAPLVLSDNGGPVDLVESGSNNAPLRGGKYSAFEGGVRAAAFAAGERLSGHGYAARVLLMNIGACGHVFRCVGPGGYLPGAVQGTVLNEMIHVADWCVRRQPRMPAQHCWSHPPLPHPAPSRHAHDVR